MIDSGEMKNQSKLAIKLGILRSEFSIILRLLKFNPLIIQELEILMIYLNQEL